MEAKVFVANKCRPFWAHKMLSAKIWLPTFLLPLLHPPSPNQAQLQKYQKKLSTFAFFIFFAFPPNVSIGDILIKHPLRAHESHSQIKIPSTDHSP